MFLLGCVLIGVGLFGWFVDPRDSANPGTWTIMGLYFFVQGVAESLPRRQRGATVVLRAAGLFVVLVFAALVIADIGFGYIP